MGGFTQIKLRDCSQRNIDTQNARLELAGVPKMFRFYSEKDVIFEYEAFLIGKGVFSENQFPKDKINSLEDFKKYWSTKALGEMFVPPFGTLQFDCYFGRTSKRAMRNLGRYIALNIREFKEFDGSFSTFMERGMTAIERQIVDESGISY
jgi:hypothetical protein